MLPIFLLRKTRILNEGSIKTTDGSVKDVCVIRPSSKNFIYIFFNICGERRGLAFSKVKIVLDKFKKKIHE